MHRIHRFGGRVGRGFCLASSRLTSDVASVGGELRVIAAICKPDEARRYLRYAGLAGEPPARASPSYESVMLEFDNTADPAVETVSDLTPGLTPDLATDLATQAADPGWD